MQEKSFQNKNVLATGLKVQSLIVFLKNKKIKNKPQTLFQETKEEKL